MAKRPHVLEVSLPEAAFAATVPAPSRRPTALLAGMLVAGSLTAFLAVHSVLAPVSSPQPAVLEPAKLAAVTVPPPAKTVVVSPPQPPQSAEPTAPISPPPAVAPPAAPAPPPGVMKVILERGQTLALILSRAGIEPADAQTAMAALAEVGDISRLPIGQEIRLAVSDDGTGELKEVTVAVDARHTLTAVRSADGTFSARASTATVRREMALKRLRIETSLYDAAVAAGLLPVLAPLVRAYAYDIDFQRDLRKDDTLDILFEREVADDGRLVRTGLPVYARLHTGGRDRVLVRFRPSQGEEEYFTAQGERIRKDMLRTPLDGARVTSAFGPRKHPILGYTRKHQGLDFGAPVGTPVVAAAEGVVEDVDEIGGYGKLVRIHHDGVWATVYAHLSRFARGLKPGQHIHQGQVVAYVGSTGLSTGPHLHYEVLKDGKPIDPAAKTSLRAPALGGADLAAFRNTVHDLEQRAIVSARDGKV